MGGGWGLLTYFPNSESGRGNVVGLLSKFCSWVQKWQNPKFSLSGGGWGGGDVGGGGVCWPNFQFCSWVQKWQNDKFSLSGGGWGGGDREGRCWPNFQLLFLSSKMTRSQILLPMGWTYFLNFVPDFKSNKMSYSLGLAGELLTEFNNGKISISRGQGGRGYCWSSVQTVFWVKNDKILYSLGPVGVIYLLCNFSSHVQEWQNPKVPYVLGWI